MAASTTVTVTYTFANGKKLTRKIRRQPTHEATLHAALGLPATIRVDGDTGFILQHGNENVMKVKTLRDSEYDWNATLYDQSIGVHAQRQFSFTECVWIGQWVANSMPGESQPRLPQLLQGNNRPSKGLRTDSLRENDDVPVPLILPDPDGDWNQDGDQEGEQDGDQDGEQDGDQERDQNADQYNNQQQEELENKQAKPRVQKQQGQTRRAHTASTKANQKADMSLTVQNNWGTGGSVLTQLARAAKRLSTPQNTNRGNALGFDVNNDTFISLAALVNETEATGRQVRVTQENAQTTFQRFCIAPFENKNALVVALDTMRPQTEQPITTSLFESYETSSLYYFPNRTRRYVSYHLIFDPGTGQFFTKLSFDDPDNSLLHAYQNAQTTERLKRLYISGFFEQNQKHNVLRSRMIQLCGKPMARIMKVVKPENPGKNEGKVIVFVDAEFNQINAFGHPKIVPSVPSLCFKSQDCASFAVGIVEERWLPDDRNLRDIAVKVRQMRADDSNDRRIIFTLDQIGLGDAKQLQTFYAQVQALNSTMPNGLRADMVLDTYPEALFLQNSNDLNTAFARRVSISTLRDFVQSSPLYITDINHIKDEPIELQVAASWKPAVKTKLISFSYGNELLNYRYMRCRVNVSLKV